LIIGFAKNIFNPFAFQSPQKIPPFLNKYFLFFYSIKGKKSTTMKYSGNKEPRISAEFFGEMEDFFPLDEIYHILRFFV
jgi:hypothetical protein